MDAVQDPKTKKENKEEKGKNLIQKIQDKIPDRDEQFEYVSIAVRLLVVFWSGALVTLNYLPKIPGLTSGEKQDITFPASLLASSLASFGLEKTAKKKGDGTYSVNSEDKPMNKKDIEAYLKSQDVIRVDNRFTLVPQGTEVSQSRVDPITNRPVGPDGKLS
tara:strand:- start:126 stop:611 length:486 start_codon:yes stop_codon:yes gene_type:complete